MIPSNIFIHSSLLSDLNTVIKNNHYTKVGVLVDENTEKHCLSFIQSLISELYIIKIESGEENKNLTTCTHIWNKLTEYSFDRKSVLLNLGGGVIGDMGGFCASTFKRGIDFIQIPTTLLSMVDASVGGKLGVDFNGFKNHIGVFKEPVAVIISTEFLLTLPKQELRSGFAEVIKHCLIADVYRWNTLLVEEFNSLDWLSIIQHSIKIKAEVTKFDPHEKGLRKILNFGHTIGHAVESWFLPQNGKKLLHGEAIAVGMICESYLSFKKHFITKESFETIKDYIILTFGKVKLEVLDIENILPLTIQDKKNENNIVQCALLEHVGKANFGQHVTETEMNEALEYYRIFC